MASIRLTHNAENSNPEQSRRRESIQMAQEFDI